jgi:hypothetical protein
MASAVADSKARGTSLSSRTMRIPRPPPPPDALRITGKPMLLASRAACSAFFKTPVPGKRGRPWRVASRRALTLSPQRRMAAGLGPMKLSPHFPQSSAKWAFSERKPYPGWMASAPVTSAALMMEGMFR